MSPAALRLSAGVFASLSEEQKTQEKKTGGEKTLTAQSLEGLPAERPGSQRSACSDVELLFLKKFLSLFASFQNEFVRCSLKTRQTLNEKTLYEELKRVSLLLVLAAVRTITGTVLVPRSSSAVLSPAPPAGRAPSSRRFCPSSGPVVAPTGGSRGTTACRPATPCSAWSTQVRPQRPSSGATPPPGPSQHTPRSSEALLVRR